MSNHFEGLGKTWLTLLNDPEKEVPAVVMQVMKEGKTRDCWQRKDSKEETMVLAWPVETGFRAGVTVHGNAGDQLRPVSTYPLLEGAPNDMTVNETYLWQNETEAKCPPPATKAPTRSGSTRRFCSATVKISPPASAIPSLSPGSPTACAAPSSTK